MLAEYCQKCSGSIRKCITVKISPRKPAFTHSAAQIRAGDPTFAAVQRWKMARRIGFNIRWEMRWTRPILPRRATPAARLPRTRITRQKCVSGARITPSLRVRQCWFASPFLLAMVGEKQKYHFEAAAVQVNYAALYHIDAKPSRRSRRLNHGLGESGPLVLARATPANAGVQAASSIAHAAGRARKVINRGLETIQ